MLLAEVREAQRRALRAQGLLLGGAAFLFLLVLAGLIGAGHPSLGFALVLASPLSAVLLLVLFGWILTARRVGDSDRTARLLAEKVPELNLDLLAAVELSRAMGTQEDFSPALARAFLLGVDERAARHPVSSLIDQRPLQRTGLLVICVVGAVLAILALKGPTVKGGLLLAVSFSETEEPARRAPITGDFQLTYRYPAYTGLELRTVPGATGDIAAPAGTEVSISTRADRDVEASALIVNGARVPLVTKGRELSGSLVVDSPGQYHVAFLRGSRVVAEGPDLSITVEVDQPPHVRITSPQDAVELDPAKQRLPLVFEASDDYGLSALQLVYRVAGGEEKRQPLKPDDGRTTRGTYQWDVGALSLRPGQSVSCYLEATDNDAVKGPKKGVSATLSVKLYSAEEHRREALRKAAELWERLVTHLADRLEGPDRSSPASPEAALAGRPVDERASQLAQDLSQLSADLREDRSAPLELAQAASNIGRELAVDTSAVSGPRRMLLRLSGKEGSGPAKGPPASHSEVGRRLSSAIASDGRHAEKNVLYLEALLDRQRLDALRALAKELKEDRRELSRLLEEYAQSKDPSIQRALLEQMAGLKARMLELRERMAELARGIRDEFMNGEALKEMLEDEHLESSLDEMERLVKEGQAWRTPSRRCRSCRCRWTNSSSSSKTPRTARIRRPTLSSRKSSRTSRRTSTRPSSSKKTLSERTRQLRDKYRQQQKERIARQGEALKRELGARLEEIEKSLKQVDASRYGPRFQELKTQAEHERENVQQSLDANDFDLAHDSADRLEERTGQLAEQADEQRRLDEMFQNPAEVRRESKQLRDRLQRDARKAEEIAQKLRDLFPQPGQQMSEADRSQLQEMAQKQKQLEQTRPGAPAADGRHQPARAPSSTRRPRGKCSRPASDAERGRAGCRGSDPGRGFGEQQGALQALRGLQQAMEEAGKGRRRGGLPLPLRGQKGGRGIADREGGDSRRGPQPGAPRVPQGRDGRDEAGRAGPVPGPEQALLRGAGEVRAALALAWCSSRRRPGAAEPDEATLPELKGEAKAHIQKLEQLLGDWDLEGAKAELADAREAGSGRRRAAGLLRGPRGLRGGALRGRHRALHQGRRAATSTDSWLRLAKKTRDRRGRLPEGGERPLRLRVPAGQGRGARALGAGRPGADARRPRGRPRLRPAGQGARRGGGQRRRAGAGVHAVEGGHSHHRHHRHLQVQQADGDEPPGGGAGLRLARHAGPRVHAPRRLAEEPQHRAHLDARGPGQVPRVALARRGGRAP